MLYLPPAGGGAAVTKSRTLAGLASGATALSIGGDLSGGSSGRRRGRGSRGRGGAGGSRRSENAAAGRAVPVGLVIAKALADGNSSVASALESLEHELSQVLGGLLVNVVSNGQEVVAGSGLASKGLGEVVLGVLDLVRGSVVVV